MARLAGDIPPGYVHIWVLKGRRKVLDNSLTPSCVVPEVE
jgi:hypothetical protein